MKYDTMSVEELLDEIDSDVVEGYPRDIEKVASLRSAVIREASVGTGNFTGEYGIGMYGEYEPQEGFSVNVDGEHEPEIVYDLIPREAP